MERWSDIDPGSFVRMLDNGELEASQIIDVREQEEWDYYHLEQSTLIPMQTIPNRAGELPADKTVYVLCAHGVRSVAVCRYLNDKGYGNLRNVSGGMAAIASIYGFQYD
ncbi:rhodanese-like domain-containing protein [Paenibacillus spongiae]|uniref:Rhodanese-like domain-containing protein n=1 Tax=Paenibacillus spongiae TaxID=2909671 RepID=A0ABY5SEG2_9BACL|nr:rhodanese-like domain-containing protein [Paenibacillus spongiae]UVI32357.1 rhodanese-like domain-containing protein [Paenibacillus spongiae]